MALTIKDKSCLGVDKENDFVNIFSNDTLMTFDQKHPIMIAHCKCFDNGMIVTKNPLYGLTQQYTKSRTGLLRKLLGS